jgi:signal peptidase I
MGKFLRGLLWTAAILGVLALLGKALLFDLWTFPDDRHFAASVAPTLRAQDRLVLLKGSEPTVGDLVRCTDPESPSEFIVARVAGRAGDHVELEGASLRINGRSYDAESACPDRSVTMPNPGEGGPDIEVRCDKVTMGSGWHYRGSNVKPRLGFDKTSADVRPGLLYLVSDDRDWHDDSRDYGQVPVASCSRKIIFRLWGGAGMGADPQRFEFIH